MAAATDEEPSHPTAIGQPENRDVEIHPIDALHLKLDVIIENIGDTARYRHHKLRSDRRPADPPTATRGSYTGPAPPVTV